MSAKNGTGAGTLRFGRFRFEPGRSVVRLHGDGGVEPVALGSRALAVLGVLAGRAGELVSKDDIMRAVWPDVTVEDGNLSVQISALRRTLDDRDAGESCIQTVPGRGYRFVPAVNPDVDGVGPTPVVPPVTWRWQPRMWTLVMLAITGVALGVGIAVAKPALGLWLGWSRPLPVAYSPQDRRQSVIVMPFENGSADPLDDGLAASITLAVTDSLAQDPTMPVVPASTAAAHRGRTNDLQTAGQAHDVHFALVGRTWRHEQRAFVSVTVYELGTGRQVWSRRVELADKPDVEEFGWRVMDWFDQASMDQEAAWALQDHPDRLDKRDLMFVGHSTPMQVETREGRLARLSLADRALALDPDYVWALRWKADLLARLVMAGLSGDPASDTAAAAASVDRALTLLPADVGSMKAKCLVLRAMGRIEEATALARRLVAIAPNSGSRAYQLGLNLMIQGRHEEAVEQFVAALRLPADPYPNAFWEADLATALLAVGRLDDAVEQSRLAMQGMTPALGPLAEKPWLTLIAGLAAKGELGEARATLQRYAAVPRTWQTLAGVRQWPPFAANPRLLAGLELAGVPDE